MNKQFKCYISASAVTNVQNIRIILEENNIQAYDDYDFLPTAKTLQETTREKIKEADFIIGVISSNNPQNVYYELGVASGLNKPIFIILDKEIDLNSLPLDLENQIYVRASLSDTNFLRLSLAGFTSNYTSNKKLKTIINKNQSIPVLTWEEASAYLERLIYIRNHDSTFSTGSEIETMIEEIFQKAHLAFGRNRNINSAKTHSPDFALWIDDLNPIIGNPIFVEVKAGVLSDDIYINAYEQLKHSMITGNARAGILLYFNKNEFTFKNNSSVSPLIMSFNIEDFIKELTEKSLDRLVLESRNKIVHGIQNK